MYKKWNQESLRSSESRVRLDKEGGEGEGQENYATYDCNCRDNGRKYQHIYLYCTHCTVVVNEWCVSPVLTEIFWATILPPITASPVHKQCPRVPPTATPNGSCRTKPTAYSELTEGIADRWWVHSKQDPYAGHVWDFGLLSYCEM